MNLILSLLLMFQAHQLPAPQMVKFANADTIYIRIVGGARIDWMVGMTASPNSFIEAIELNSTADNVTLPKVGFTSNRIQVEPRGDRTVCVHFGAPAGTNVVITGSNDNEILYTGAVGTGGVISQGQVIKTKVTNQYAALLALAGVTHSQRMQLNMSFDEVLKEAVRQSQR